MTYLDWREPVRLLELKVRPSTSAQHALADQLGLAVQGGEPYVILGVMLEEHVMPLIWGAEFSCKPASERQRQFLRSLGGAALADVASLTKRVASAWIDHYLALRTAEALRRLQLKKSDAVIKRTVWRGLAREIPPHETLEYHFVSSIAASGLVYFKGGNGSCAWPSSLYLADPEETPTAIPNLRLSAVN